MDAFFRVARIGKNPIRIARIGKKRARLNSNGMRKRARWMQEATHAQRDAKCFAMSFWKARPFFEATISCCSENSDSKSETSLGGTQNRKLGFENETRALRYIQNGIQNAPPSIILGRHYLWNSKTTGTMEGCFDPGSVST